MKQPSVTVLLTVRNNGGTIEKCVKSILNQNYSNFELYVTDAFSTDGTYEILKKFGQKIRLEQIKGSPPISYNYMIKKINTEFVALTDGDCIVDKNWLKELISSFKDKTIGAVAGYCATPKTENKLQQIIGCELEARYKKFPNYISRAPTMNICVRTELVRKIKFNEKLFVGYDTDFGYDLSRLGKKMYYNSKALIWHYHRATWKKFFKQQYIYGKYIPILYLKHRKKIIGDHISTPLMMIQPSILFTIVLFAILSALFGPLILISLSLVIFLISLYVYETMKLPKCGNKILFLPFFFYRNIAWSFGVFVGIINVILRRKTN